MRILTPELEGELIDSLYVSLLLTEGCMTNGGVPLPLQLT
jgi:hypothetical protein